MSTVKILAGKCYACMCNIRDALFGHCQLISGHIYTDFIPFQLFILVCIVIIKIFVCYIAVNVKYGFTNLKQRSNPQETFSVLRFGLINVASITITISIMVYSL